MYSVKLRRNFYPTLVYSILFYTKFYFHFTAQEVSVDDLPPQDVHIEYVKNEVREAFETVKALPKSNDKVRATTLNLLSSLTIRVNSCNNNEALEQLNKQLTSALSTFDACNKFQGVKNINLLKSPPGNKNVEKQLNFFSTKKKRKSKNKIRFARPTSEDLKDFFQSKDWEHGMSVV